MVNNADDMRANLEKQIEDMKKEISKISKSLAAQGWDVMDDAEEAFEQGKGRARQAARQVGDRAYAAADIARENPGTTAMVLSTVGLLGLTAGLALGGIFASGGGHHR